MPLTEFSEETSKRINNALEDRSIKTSKTETQIEKKNVDWNIQEHRTILKVVTFKKREWRR